MFREPNRIGDPDFVKKGPCRKVKWRKKKSGVVTK